jgi:hypothetical protein
MYHAALIEKGEIYDGTGISEWKTRFRPEMNWNDALTRFRMRVD